MSDIGITKDASGEFMVARVEGLTPEGEEFVDSYVPRSNPAALNVVDAGDIVIPEQDIDDVVASATGLGLTVEVD